MGNNTHSNAAIITTRSQCKDQIIMAPLLGITDSGYRQAFSKYFGGFDYAVSPFLRTLAGGRCKASKLRDLHPRENQNLPIQPQIISNQAADFIAIARMLHDWGYQTVNLNLGCPVPMAAGRGCGAGLLAEPDYLKRLLEAILEGIPGKLAIKTRIGYQHDDELLTLCETLNQLPIQEITIHARRARDLYQGSINHTALNLVVAELHHPLIYSGDINSFEDWNILRQRYPTIRKWMLGRGGIRCPDLAQLLRREGTMRPDSTDRLRQFYIELEATYLRQGLQPFQTLQKLKALWFYQINPITTDPRLLKAMRKEKRLDHFHYFLEDLLAAPLTKPR